MEPNELQSKRWQIGTIALLLLLISGFIFWFDPSRQAVYSALLRVGLLLGAFWLAIPVMIRHPKILRWLPWYLIGGIILLVTLASKAWALIPLFILLGILSMFAGKRPKNRR